MSEKKVKKEMEKQIQFAQKSLDFEKAHYLAKQIKEMDNKKSLGAIWPK